MIRKFKEEDTTKVMTIWTKGNFKAHDFIEKDYWLKNFNQVKNEYLSKSETYVYTEEELLALLEMCKRHDIFLVVDEVYREFCYDGKKFTSVLSFPEYADRVICIDSFSKRFSMCGSRIGAIVTKNKEFMENCLKMAQARLCSPAVEQVAAEAALSAPQSYIDGTVAEYEKRRNILVSSSTHRRPPGRSTRSISA